MRYRHFVRVMLSTGVAETLPFEVAHYREANVLVTPDFGMHELEAIALLNKWNRLGGSKPVFVYYI